MLGSGLGLAPGRAARLGAGAPGTTRRCRAAGGGGPLRRPGRRPWGPCPACRPCAPAARSAAAACCTAAGLPPRRAGEPPVPGSAGGRQQPRLVGCAACAAGGKCRTLAGMYASSTGAQPGAAAAVRPAGAQAPACPAPARQVQGGPGGEAGALTASDSLAVIRPLAALPLRRALGSAGAVIRARACLRRPARRLRPHRRRLSRRRRPGAASGVGGSAAGPSGRGLPAACRRPCRGRWPVA